MCSSLSDRRGGRGRQKSWQSEVHNLSEVSGTAGSSLQEASIQSNAPAPNPVSVEILQQK